MTSIHENDTVFAEFKDHGLSQKVVQALEMIQKEEILSQYDFDSLKPDSKGMFRIWIPDYSSGTGKIRIYAKNIDNLKEKVYSRIKAQPCSIVFRTFAYVFEETQKYELQNTIPERAVSRANTIDKNYSEYRRFFKDTFFEGRLIDCITVRDLDEIIRFNLKRYPLTKAGRNSMRTIINMTFKRALYMEWIDDNPAQRLIWRDYDRLLHRPAPINKRAFSDAQIRSMAEADRERQIKDPSFITPYAHEFQILTGFRRAEICPLRWDDVDFERGEILVHQEQLVDKRNNREQVIVDYTKTFKDRIYPIADLERNFLRKLYDVHEKYYPDSHFLFPAKTANGCITCEAVESYHVRLCKKLGIQVSKEYQRGPHAFRRTRITETVNSTNGNVVLAAQIYGNSPETIRQNYYTHDSIDKMREVLNNREAI